MTNIIAFNRLKRLVKEAVPQLPPLVTRRQDLIDSMFSRKEVTITTKTGLCIVGIVNSVMVEDGSGFNFIVGMHTGDKFFIRLPA